MKIYLSSKKVSPKIENSKIISRAIEQAKDGDTLVFPAGMQLPIHKTIVQHNKTLNWEGNGCTIMTGYAVTAIQLTRDRPTGRTRINQLELWCRQESKDKEAHGLSVSVPVIVEGLTVRNFPGHGITVFADVQTMKGSDASFCRFTSCFISGCGGSGMYFQGGDANQSYVAHVDVRDNQGYGIHDASFLGNQFFACMAHGNKLGNYAATDLNNRTGFFGCYSEMGSPPEDLRGHAYWIGGLPSNQIKTDNFAKIFSNE